VQLEVLVQLGVLLLESLLGQVLAHLVRTSAQGILVPP
jgi:hypothetical protein